jgi:hypothetical protein
MHPRLRDLAAILGLCSWMAVLAPGPGGSVRGCAMHEGQAPGAAQDMDAHRHDGDGVPTPCRCIGHMCCVALSVAPKARAVAAPPRVLAAAPAPARAPVEPALGATPLLQPPALGPPPA